MKFLRWLFGSYYRREVNLRSGRQKRFGDKRQRDRPLGEDRPRSSNASGPRGSQGGVGILSHFAARDAAQAATAECNFALAVPGTIMNKCIAAMHRRIAMKLAAVTLKRPMAQFRRF
jgi:hypothetical protein